MRRNFVGFMLMVVFCVCVVGFAGQACAQIADNAKALAALDNEWSNAAAARDVEKVASFYAEDATGYPPNEPVVHGRAALREAWGKMLADPNSKLTWKTATAGVDGKTGFTAGTYEASGAGPDGKPMTEKGKYLCVWRKGSDGKWKAIHDMWNTDSK